MALNDSTAPQRQKEEGSLGITDSGRFARRVFIDEESRMGNLLSGVDFDRFTGVETSATVETYQYFLNNVLQATVVVTYSDSSKQFVEDARRTL